MQGVDTTRNRPCRWGPTRALLWERWRMLKLFWWPLGILAMVRVTSWATSASIAFAQSMEFFIILMAVHGSPMRREGRAFSTLPTYQLRLPVSNGYLALLNYGYALLCLFIYILFLLVIARFSESGPAYQGVLIHTMAALVIAFVAVHLLFRLGAARAWVEAIPFVVLSAAFLLLWVSHSINGRPHWSLLIFKKVGPVVWIAAAVTAVIVGYFVSWAAIARERRTAAEKPDGLRLPSFRFGEIRKQPFSSPLRAQVWLEYRRYRPFLAVFLGVVPMAIGFTWFGAPLGSRELYGVARLAQSLRTGMLVAIPFGAYFAGVMIAGKNGFAKGHERVFFFARPVSTPRLAGGRLVFCALVTVALLTVAGVTEVGYRIAIHSHQQELDAREAQLRIRAGVPPTGPIPDNEVTHELDVLLQDIEKARVAGIDRTWIVFALAYALLVWSCMAGDILIGYAYGALMASALMFAFSATQQWAGVVIGAISVGLVGYSAMVTWESIRHRLIGLRALVLCGLGFLVCAVVIVPHASAVIAKLPLPDIHAPAKLLVMTLMVLPFKPFAFVPWQLYHERHQ